MKYEKKSTLLPALQSLLSNTNAEDVRTLAIQKVQDSKVNPTSKASMVQTLEQSKDPLGAVYNLILKFEGNGVIK